MAHLDSFFIWPKESITTSGQSVVFDAILQRLVGLALFHHVVCGHLCQLLQVGPKLRNSADLRSFVMGQDTPSAALSVRKLWKLLQDHEEPFRSAQGSGSKEKLQSPSGQLGNVGGREIRLTAGPSKQCTGSSADVAHPNVIMCTVSFSSLLHCRACTAQALITRSTVAQCYEALSTTPPLKESSCNCFLLPDYCLLKPTANSRLLLRCEAACSSIRSIYQSSRIRCC